MQALRQRTSQGIFKSRTPIHVLVAVGYSAALRKLLVARYCERPLELTGRSQMVLLSAHTFEPIGLMTSPL
jgi:hypothetical protein